MVRCLLHVLVSATENYYSTGLPSGDRNIMLLTSVSNWKLALSAAAASPPSTKTDGDVAHNLPTRSWTIKALMEAYGVRDVCFLLLPGTKGLCNHQVSLVWSFKSSLYCHYIC